MSKLNVCVKSDLSNVVFNKDENINVMASICAPDLDKSAKRNPLSICAVIDRSGSMYGDKIEHVRGSVCKMIDHLTDNDSLAFVFFDNYVEKVPFSRMTSANKEKMKQAISNLDTRGSTDIGSALMAANTMFKDYEGEASSIERIMLLTDGQANIGASTMDQFEPIIGKTRKGVTLSTFGYGLGFNEDLLKDISKQGKGNSYFIESPDGVSKVFAVELGGLLTCFAQDIVLSIKTHKGFNVINVLNDMDVSTRQDSDGELVTDVKIGDIYGGENREVIVRFGFEKRNQALPRPIVMADISTSYRSMVDAENHTDEHKIKIEVVKTITKEMQERDQRISEQVAILEAASAMSKAKKMADDGDWKSAQVFINTASCNLRSLGTEKTSTIAEDMNLYSLGLSASYTAGDSLSKGIGNYASAQSTRGINAFGNQSSTKSVKVNAVMEDLLTSFSNGTINDSCTDKFGDSCVLVDSSTDTNSESSPVGYSKQRTSR